MASRKGMETRPTARDDRAAPRMPLSDQIRIVVLMANPSIRGLALMMGEEWQPEAERLEAENATLREALEAIEECSRDSWAHDRARTALASLPSGTGSLANSEPESAKRDPQPKETGHA